MKTKRINTIMATPGMVVAEDIYSFSDQLIIGIDTELTDRMITRLKFYSIRELTIYDTQETSAPAPINLPAFDSVAENNLPADAPFVSVFRPLPPTTPIPDQEPYSSKIKHSSDFKSFSKAFSSSIVSYRGRLNSIAEDSDTLEINSLLYDVNKILSSCSTPTSLFDMLMCIRDLDDATYVHGLNVSLITTVFATWLKLSDDEIHQLALAGLLHDIGKLKVPKVLLTKSSALTADEFTEMKAHSLYGYNILKDTPLPESIKLAVLMHHERCDGSGYPMGLTGDQLHPFAKIIAIADVYDAMTAARVYRGPICPLEVIGIFESEGLRKYDPKYLIPFIRGIVETYLNHTVTLSNGQQGQIIMINQTALSRPVIHLNDGSYLDLSKNPSISIIGMS